MGGGQVCTRTVLLRVKKYTNSAFGAGGGTRTLTGLPPTDFRTNYGFRRSRRSASAQRRICGLDYPFTVAFAKHGVRLRCCPSSLYTFSPFGSLARDCHFTGFPDFEQFCTDGFPPGTQVFRSSPLRLPFRHARTNRLNLYWRQLSSAKEKLPNSQVLMSISLLSGTLRSRDLRRLTAAASMFVLM
jgi:hypothetical protein